MRYWLTPPSLMIALQEEFEFDFDACPNPRPNGFDGLRDPWGQRNWVNPPFNEPVTRWIRKAIQTPLSVVILPVPRWLHDAIVAGCEIRPVGTVRWRAIEDPTQERDSPYPHVLVIRR